MHFSDIFKASFLSQYTANGISRVETVILLLLACVLGLYLYGIYRIITRKEFYSKHFNLSIVAVSVIVAGIIITIRSDLVVSLGMVGALSIVRFRTAVKDPLDLIFLFWSISVGIMCGASLAYVAVVMSLILTAVVFFLDKMPMVRLPLILIVHADYTPELYATVQKEIQTHAKAHRLKARNRKGDRLELVFELRAPADCPLVDTLSALPNVKKVSLLEHDGEVTF